MDLPSGDDMGDTGEASGLPGMHVPSGRRENSVAVAFVAVRTETGRQPTWHLAAVDSEEKAEHATLTVRWWGNETNDLSLPLLPCWGTEQRHVFQDVRPAERKCRTRHTAQLSRLAVLQWNVILPPTGVLPESTVQKIDLVLAQSLVASARRQSTVATLGAVKMVIGTRHGNSALCILTRQSTLCWVDAVQIGRTPAVLELMSLVRSQSPRVRVYGGDSLMVAFSHMAGLALGDIVCAKPRVLGGCFVCNHAGYVTSFDACMCQCPDSVGAKSRTLTRRVHSQ
jgi:hypothetical protein